MLACKQLVLAAQPSALPVRLRSTTSTATQQANATAGDAPVGSRPSLAFMAAFGGGAAHVKRPLVYIPPSVSKEAQKPAAPAASLSAMQSFIPAQLVRSASHLPESRFPWQQGFGQSQVRPSELAPQDSQAQAAAVRAAATADANEVQQRLDRYVPSVNLQDFQSEDEKLNAKSLAQKKKEMRQREAINMRKAKGGQEVDIPENINPRALSNLLGVNAVEVVKHCIRLGMPIMESEQGIPQDIVDLVADEFGFRVARKVVKDASSEAVTRLAMVNKRRAKLDEKTIDKNGLVRRAPVVCIMGHVDHGKTSLLDALRGSSIASGEAGGITQHIRSFVVSMPSGEKITFLDTPGHMAFLDMRSRGASLTDIVVLVIAADDGIREQTVESINLIRKSGAKMIVALNKIDKSSADTEKVKRDLLAYEVVLEDHGGDIQCVQISATKKLGLEELEQAIVLQADDMGLYAEASGGDAVLLESYKDPRYGAVMVTLVKNGKIKVGDYFVAGTSYGRIRTILDSEGLEMDEVGPSMPARLIGSRALPEPVIVESETVAKQVASKQANERADSTEMKESQQKAIDAQVAQKKVALERLIAMREGEQVEDPKEVERRSAQEEEKRAASEREFKMLIKTDMSGSVAAVEKLISDIPQDEVRATVIKTGTGVLSEAEIDLAASSGASVLGFNMQVPSKARLYAEKMKVPVNNFDIVYQLLDHVRAEMSKMLPRKKVLTYTGEAEVLQIFTIKAQGKKVNVAGSRMNNGSLNRKNRVQVLRKGAVVHDGPIETLKHFKEDVQEVKNGQECGIAVDRFPEVQPGDVIRSYTVAFETRELAEQKRTDVPRVFSQGNKSEERN